MAVSAYVLIQTEVGRAAAVSEAMRAVPGVRDADVVIGPYDIVLRLDGSTMDEIAQSVVTRIQVVEGITRTLTCEVVHL